MAVNEKVRTQLKEWLDKKEISVESSIRSKKFEEYCKAHEKDSEDPLNWKRHRTIFTNELRKELVRRNTDPVTYGLSRPRNSDNKFHQDNGGLDPKIQPNPKQRKLSTTYANATGNVLQSKQQAQQGIDPNKPALVNPETGEPIPPQDVIQITQEMVESVWETIGALIKIKYPSFKKFGEPEVKKLGVAWLPLFQEYLQTQYLKWGIPLFVTGGVFLPRIIEMKDPEEKERPAPKDQRKEDKKKTKDEDSMTWQEYQKKLKERK